MKNLRYIFRTLVVAVVFIAAAGTAYAQKPGSKSAEENVLKYRYVDKESRKVTFTTPRTFAERFYLLADTGIEGLFNIGNHPVSPGYAIGSHIGAGYWFTPIHGMEVSLNYGMMPYGYWKDNFLGTPVITNSIIRNIGLEANYVLNLTNYTHRHDRQNRFEVLYTVGASVGAGTRFQYGLNTSFRAVYNIGSLAGLYIEPKVSLLNMEHVRPAISAGFTFRIRHTDQGFEEPVDDSSKKLMFALKSNALFWIAGAPNFGIEVPINKRWSVNADYVAPWSSSFATGLYYQLLMVNAEGRYWFGDRENKPVMTGLFAGLYAGGGYYDFMFDNTRTGIQGEFYIMAGASVGYAHSISSNDRLRLEYALGLGFIQTRYRKYVWDYFDYVLTVPSTQTWKTSIIGPTQLKVSLVWLIYKNKKGGVR